jgi:hypothetical protein
MHYVRLLYECRELLKNKYLTLPRPYAEREHLIAIRSGKYTQDEVFNDGHELKMECEVLLAGSELPELPDIEAVSEIVAGAYLQHWASIEIGL